MDRAATGMKIDIEEARQAASSLFENLRKDQKDAAWRLFQTMDEDKNGYLSFEEFMTYLTNTGFETENCYWLFTELDKDKNGFLDFMELVTFFYVLLQSDECKHQLSRANAVGTLRENPNTLFASTIPYAGANDRNPNMLFASAIPYAGTNDQNPNMLFASAIPYAGANDRNANTISASTIPYEHYDMQVENGRLTAEANDQNPSMISASAIPYEHYDMQVENRRPTAGANDRGLSPEWQESIRNFTTGMQIGYTGVQIAHFLVQTGCTIV